MGFWFTNFLAEIRGLKMAGWSDEEEDKEGLRNLREARKIKADAIFSNSNFQMKSVTKIHEKLLLYEGSTRTL